MHDEAKDAQRVTRENTASGQLPSSTGSGRPVRKLIHLAVAVVPAIAWFLSYELALALAGALLAASLAIEVARRRWPWVNRLLWRFLPATFKEGEQRRALGSTWFSLGMLAALVLFGRDVGSTAILFLTWGDPAAEFGGRRWGSPRKKKTLAGSLACLAACLVAGLVGMGLGGLSPWVVLAGAGVATAVERWAPPPDDNVWIPVLAGLTMAASQWLMYSV
jgi:dolichol kinase